MKTIGLLLLLLTGCSTQQPPAITAAPDVAAVQDQAKHVWTCVDKSRVLLRAEDGTLHCVKL